MNQIDHILGTKGVICLGDHVKQWYWPDDKAIRVERIEFHRATDQKVITGRRITTNALVAMHWTDSVVVIFHPMTDSELFETAEGLSRDHDTGCRTCGAKWRKVKQSYALDHLADCRYVRTLDQRDH